MSMLSQTTGIITGSYIEKEAGKVKIVTGILYYSKPEFK